MDWRRRFSYLRGLTAKGSRLRLGFDIVVYALAATVVATALHMRRRIPFPGSKSATSLHGIRIHRNDVVLITPISVFPYAVESKSGVSIVEPTRNGQQLHPEIRRPAGPPDGLAVRLCRHAGRSALLGEGRGSSLRSRLHSRTGTSPSRRDRRDAAVGRLPEGYKRRSSASRKSRSGGTNSASGSNRLHRLDQAPRARVTLSIPPPVHESLTGAPRSVKPRRSTRAGNPGIGARERSTEIRTPRRSAFVEHEPRRRGGGRQRVRIARHSERQPRTR